MDIDQDRAAAEKRYMEMLKEIVLREVPDSYAVFLFGSRARGEKKKAADADIGILGTTPLPLEVKKRIYAQVEASIIPMKVDVVDFSQVDPEFKQSALKNIEIWRSHKTIKLG